MVENHREGPKWVRGSIVEKLGPLSYRVQVGEQLWRRHGDQLLRADVSPKASNTGGTAEEDIFTRTSPQSADRCDADDRSTQFPEPVGAGTTPELTVAPPRYPPRRHAPPVRFDPSFH